LPHSLIDWVVLLGAALAGGAVNALAGGGAFMVFPALLFAGTSPIVANATASLALMPGGWASTWVYRDRLTHYGKRLVWTMGLTSLAGGTIGSLLLLNTSNTNFAKLVPWLMFGAASIFTLAGWLRKLASAHQSDHIRMVPLLIGQLIVTIYGGYFGAGLGVLMITLILVFSNMDVHTASGIRIMCGSITNLIAVIIFAERGIIDWRTGVPMFVFAILGGYVGAMLVKRLDSERVRYVILYYAWGITLWLIVRSYI
jgi:uncharacterized protein